MYNPYFSNYPLYPQSQVHNNASFQALNGRIVSNVSEIGVNDVPMDGTMAIFPNRNGKEIYSKQWLPSGTIDTHCYSLNEGTFTTETTNSSANEKTGLNEAIYEKLEAIEKLLTSRKEKEEEKVKHE